jgi:hypothetical protein
MVAFLRGLDGKQYPGRRFPPIPGAPPVLAPVMSADTRNALILRAHELRHAGKSYRQVAAEMGGIVGLGWAHDACANWGRPDCRGHKISRYEWY